MNLNPTVTDAKDKETIGKLCRLVLRGWPFIPKRVLRNRVEAAVVLAIARATQTLRREHDTLLIAEQFQRDTLKTIAWTVGLPSDYLDARELMAPRGRAQGSG